MVNQVTCALTEMSKAEECEIPIMNCYPRLLAAMLINTASMVGAKPPKLDKVASHYNMLHINNYLCHYLYL